MFFSSTLCFWCQYPEWHESLHLISQLVMALHFCNLALLTHPSNPNIFSSFKVGALELADPDCPLFLLTALLSKTYPYFFQGPRLSSWAPLFLYLASHLPSLSCLVREHSLFCSKQFNHGMVQFRLLGHPSSVISSSTWITWHCQMSLVVAFWLATFLVFSLGFIFTFLLTIWFSCLLIILLRHTLFSFFNFL